eukprot:GEMP01134529.1.p1 GENE.GEMP01134529.1~~GEMP01134529.1.p1  ORF type:complete len:119 (-),score=4.06 GEMP01134529.1:87-443(-)
MHLLKNDTYGVKNDTINEKKRRPCNCTNILQFEKKQQQKGQFWSLKSDPCFIAGEGTHGGTSMQYMGGAGYRLRGADHCWCVYVRGRRKVLRFQCDALSHSVLRSYLSVHMSLLAWWY